MAYTKIHPIKATVNKAIDYICNPEKTDESIYISSFACAAETAAYDFKYTLDHANDFNSIKKDEKENKAFHLIQAFSPGEVSFEETHAIGKELADKLLGGKYSYVLTTHIDKGHVHNHIIFCAVDNLQFNHYHDCKKSYWCIRNLSDDLCREHNLSVIDTNNCRGMKYKEWSENRNQNSWKAKLRKDINQSIKASSNYEEFLALMKAKGYEMKNTALDNSSGKYIAFRPFGQDNFIRGRAKSLGSNYTKQRIKERIDNKKLRSTDLPQSSKKIQRLIDIDSSPKFTENIGLKKWAAKENLQIAAKTYNYLYSKNVHSFSDLDDRITFLKEQAKSINSHIVSLEQQLRQLAEIIKYAEQYLETKTYNDRYLKAKDQERFFQKYESQLILFGGAERMLQQKGINLKQMNLQNLKEQYQTLDAKRSQLSKDYKTVCKEKKDLDLCKENIIKYLNISPQDLEKMPVPTIFSEL